VTIYNRISTSTFRNRICRKLLSNQSTELLNNGRVRGVDLLSPDGNDHTQHSDSAIPILTEECPSASLLIPLEVIERDNDFLIILLRGHSYTTAGPPAYTLADGLVPYEAGSRYECHCYFSVRVSLSAAYLFSFLHCALF